MTLFDPGPPDDHHTDEPASYERRLTLWRRATLEAGIHPVTGLALLDDGSTCGTCTHHVLQGGVGGRYHKCDLNITGGPKTDLRIGWPACQRYEARP